MTATPEHLSEARIAALYDVFSRLDAAAERASAAVADAITYHGSTVVADALGVSHQTALRWARHGLKVPTLSPTDTLAEALEQARQANRSDISVNHGPADPAAVSVEL